MTTRHDLTDTLIELIPEDGRRVSNEEIQDALEKAAGEPVSDMTLKQIKARIIELGIAEAAKGPGGGLKAIGVESPPKTTRKKDEKKMDTGKSANSDKSLESWIWDAACSIRGAKDAPKYKDYILPLVFTKRLCDVFDDELDRIADEVRSRKKAFTLVDADPKLVRFYLPLRPEDPNQPVWSCIRKLTEQIGEGVTSHMRAIASSNPLLKGIIDEHGDDDLAALEGDDDMQSFDDFDEDEDGHGVGMHDVGDDHDHTGSMSPEEEKIWREDEERFFKEADADKDGHLDKDEYTRAMMKEMSPHAGADPDEMEGGAAMPPPPSPALAGTGPLSTEGMTEDEKTHFEELGKQFVEEDLDKDGKISLEEWFNMMFHDMPQEPEFEDGHEDMWDHEHHHEHHNQLTHDPLQGTAIDPYLYVD